MTRASVGATTVRTVTVASVAVLLVMGVLAGVAVGAGGVGGSEVASDTVAERPALSGAETPERSTGLASEVLQTTMDPDNVLLAIELESDGDAVWTIEYRTRLDTEDDEAAFDDLQADIEADPDAYTATFHDRMNDTAADATEATGREMTITDMTVSADRTELPREYGVVTYSFRWTNFGVVADDQLRAGDAIDGLFLDDASSLRIGWGGDWTLATATPAPTETRSDTVIWHGPTSFAGGEPRVTLDSTTADVDDGGAAPDDGNAGSDIGPSEGDVSALTIALIVVLLLVGVSAVAMRRRWIGPIGPFGAESGAKREDGTETDEAASTTVGEGRAGEAATTGDTDHGAVDGETGDVGEGSDIDSDGDGDRDGGDDTDRPDDRDRDTDGTRAGDGKNVEHASESDAPADEAAADDEESDSPFGAGVDPALLSNEEKVLRLIEANGGRMKQKRVAEELDWTAAKTSQVTKRLREDGDLDGFRLGRENVLTLPEEDPR